MKTIEQAIHQKEFSNSFVKAEVNILYTASWISAVRSRALRPLDLTVQQFNVLRILRGVYPGSVSLRYVAERMIDQTSNASRLVDKLLQKGLVVRKECSQDRRQVEIGITPDGLQRVAEASEVMSGSFSIPFPATDEELLLLSDILDKIRNH